MIVITINNIISFILLGLLILGITIYMIYAFIRGMLDRKFKKNCYECKYWQLNDVSGSGGIAWYKCKNNCFKDEVRQDFNDNYYYVKCDKFEKE